MINRLRGTKDLIAKEACQWELVEQIFQNTMKRFGFDPIRTPIFEETALFKRSVGEVTDIVQKEMYSFIDRSDQSISLRPEGTASIVRAYIQNQLDKERAIQKLYYYGPMFRAERPQAGRQRQFHQFGVEILGSSSIFADVENIESLVLFLNNCGVRGFNIEINSLGSTEDRNKYKVELKRYFEEFRSELSEDALSKLDNNVFRLLDSKDKKLHPLIDAAPMITSYLSTEKKDRFHAIVDALRTIEIDVSINTRIVRGLDYYTDTVFELKHPALGAQDALAAGGRYDGLVEQLGGRSHPATGYALGVERLLMVMDSSCQVTEDSHEFLPSVLVIGMGDELQKSAYNLVSNIRKVGVTAEMEMEVRSVKASMRMANKRKFRFVIVLGETELESHRVTLKDMAQIGNESGAVVAIHEAPRFILERLRNGAAKC